MSNQQYAYGWDGHILYSELEGDTKPESNQIAIPDDIFQRLFLDYCNCHLSDEIEVKQIGNLNSDVIILATGRAFTNAWPSYGTIFCEADALADGNNPVSRDDLNKTYLDEMKRIYGLDLPPCRLMVGACS